MLMCFCSVDRLSPSWLCRTNTSFVFPCQILSRWLLPWFSYVTIIVRQIHPINRHRHICYNGIMCLKVWPNDWSSTSSACLKGSTRIAVPMSIPAHKNAVNFEWNFDGDLTKKELGSESGQVAFSFFFRTGVLLTSLFSRRWN